MVKLALKGLNHIINVLGVKDLFWMPVQQYKQDGRIVRGLQRGAHSFSTSTAMAMLELSNRLVTTIQVCSETTTVICNNCGDCFISSCACSSVHLFCSTKEQFWLLITRSDWWKLILYEIFCKNFERKCGFRVVARHRSPLPLKMNLSWNCRRQF